MKHEECYELTVKGPTNPESRYASDRPEILSVLIEPADWPSVQKAILQALSINAQVER